jgi:hypothetical protein
MLSDYLYPVIPQSHQLWQSYPPLNRITSKIAAREEVKKLFCNALKKTVTKYMGALPSVHGHSASKPKLCYGSEAAVEHIGQWYIIVRGLVSYTELNNLFLVSALSQTVPRSMLLGSNLPVFCSTISLTTSHFALSCLCGRSSSLSQPKIALAQPLQRTPSNDRLTTCPHLPTFIPDLLAK